ncbi:hypothetical protein F5X68DRAFT_233835 [Plectosphaerella plurivora]|uniref:Uncharacterized protein n=1 Tax=Plectosphaerella plurivora TaxID=936078 RepID=A0A9P9A870_9PEZI|nr:hypothetical protein F5X68DRAFT_233835 [Plectosphaerella plurivora]
MAAVHARQGSGASTISLGYPAPGSPTLTNPDMILPDYDGPDLPDRSESPLSMWQNNHHQASGSYQNFYMAGPVTPTTPIIYGNGTMLSDIGEVTEVESTVGRSPIVTRRIEITRIDDQTTPKTSPTLGGPGPKKRPRPQQDRRASVGSNSTVTSAHDQGGHFADFDDAVSVDDSVFQGDDEESIAESTIEERQAKFLPRPDGLGLNNDNRNSTVSLSQKAEEILANAKKRLTTMEGNLSRARGSLHSHSPSNSSIGSATPSPPLPKQESSATSPSSAPGHARMWSDFSGGHDSSVPQPQTKRAASALGAAGGYRQPLSGSQSMGDLAGPYSRGKLTHHPTDTGLEPLTEDDYAGSHLKRDSARLDSFLSPTFGTHLDRPASAAQVRDLKDQMQGLKGKISSLREQAKADSMRRRSMQSLRTPSPFTNAQVDQWYAAEKKPPVAANVPKGRNPWNGELESVDGEALAKLERDAVARDVIEDDEESVVSEYEAAQEAIRDEEQANSDVTPEDAEIIDDMRTEDGFQDDDDYRSESGDSVYHDTHQTPLSHEDREDAFDYEHFFLHSALGSFSRRRGSVDTYTSDGSVETTRGPMQVDSDASGSLRRRGSGDTMTTVDSFATATEGRSSRAISMQDEVGVVSTAQVVLIPERRTSTPPTATRASFSPTAGADSPRSLNDERPLRQRSSSVIYSRPFSSSAAYRGRPSIASIESIGTNRSFPLVNRPRLNGGVLTPQGTPPHGSPEPALKHVAESLMGETASLYAKERANGSGSPAMQQIAREDQILVERLVASLGKCVLDLSEAGRASAESRDLRRRLDMARRLLEGSESV